MDIILTVYGQTLAGERVQGSARFPRELLLQLRRLFLVSAPAVRGRSVWV